MFEAHADVRGAALPWMPVWAAWRACAHACRVRTLSSGSALWNPLPCRDVNTNRTRWAKGRASDSRYLTVY